MGQRFVGVWGPNYSLRASVQSGLGTWTKRRPVPNSDPYCRVSCRTRPGLSRSRRRTTRAPAA